MAKSKQSGHGWVKRDDRVFTLEVYIIDGPMTEEFAKKNKVVCRTIQIRGYQTLEDLHYAIFDAFDRFDEHLYEFQIGGKGPRDLKAKSYVSPLAMEGPFGEEDSSGTVDETIGSLGLKEGNAFFYWFDFGDDWWHRINVMAIEDKAGRGKYPKVSKRVGESPPQYWNCDEEDDE